MQFSKLRLTGFKSFVDPTDLYIQNGLTGVVGPNGCGKSNLLEALRWVMGENRPTSMRGSGMEDVIFAGAASRPARNFAEVSIHIDNSDRLAPAGFNALVAFNARELASVTCDDELAAAADGWSTLWRTGGTSDWGPGSTPGRQPVQQQGQGLAVRNGFGRWTPCCRCWLRKTSNGPTG